MILDSEKTLVLNWFEKEHIEACLNRKITDDEYLAIVERWNTDGWFVNTSELINEWLRSEGFEK